MSKISITYANINDGKINIVKENLLSKQTLTKYRDKLSVNDFYSKYVVSKKLKQPTIILDCDIDDNKKIMVFKEIQDTQKNTNSNVNYQFIIPDKSKLVYDSNINVFCVNTKDFTSYEDVKTTFNIKKRVVKIKKDNDIETKKSSKSNSVKKNTNVKTRNSKKKINKKIVPKVDMGIIDESLTEDNDLSLLLIEKDEKDTGKEEENELDNIEEEEEDKKEEEEEEGEEGDYDLPENSEEEVEEEGEEFEEEFIAAEEEEEVIVEKKKEKEIKKKKVGRGRGRKKEKIEKQYNYNDILKEEVWIKSMEKRVLDINYRRKILDILIKTCKMNNLNARMVEMSIYNYAIKNATSNYIFSDTNF